MEDANFDELIAGMKDVLAFQKGERKGFTVHAGSDVKAIRAKTKLTQSQFANTFGLEISTIRDWEQGRRQPERAAQVLLQLIDKDANTVRRMLANA